MRRTVLALGAVVLRPTAPLLALGLGALWLRERAARRAAERLGAGLFEALLNAIDANDDDTGRHVRRVAASAIALADAAGLDDAMQREVEHVALFHDIGKIHSALFDIVHDGHQLTDADRRAIATHPERGADVLAPLTPFYPYLAEGVVSHHERWDGSGYPHGLRGEDIPLTARIVAISDSFDAIVHARRYSAGQSVDAALEAIRRGRGTQFDPALVDLFLSPAVQRCVAAENARLGTARRPKDRRQDRHEPLTPDVAFRWRHRVVPRPEPMPGDAAPRRREPTRGASHPDGSPQPDATR